MVTSLHLGWSSSMRLSPSLSPLRCSLFILIMRPCHLWAVSLKQGGWFLSTMSDFLSPSQGIEPFPCPLPSFPVQQNVYPFLIMISFGVTIGSSGGSGVFFQLGLVPGTTEGTSLFSGRWPQPQKCCSQRKREHRSCCPSLERLPYSPEWAE